MPDKLTFGKTFQALEKAMSIAQDRNSYITSNISNIDTPGYKPKDIDFKQELASALETNRGVHLKKTDPKHIGIDMNGRASTEPFEETREWNGYNWVNIDKEMTKLTENNLTYRSAVEVLLRRISLLKEVIKEGGR